MKTPIKIFGKNSSKYEYFKYHLNEQLNKLRLDIPIVEVNDLDDIIEANIEAIPAVIINDKTQLVCYPTQNVNDFIRDTLHQILIEYKYGKMKKILVPTDFSESSVNAFSYACELARKINASITLSHYYHPTLDTSTITDYKESLQRKLEEMVEDERKVDHSLENIIYISTDLKMKFATEEILDQSKSNDIIIMATSRGEGGSNKWFGSVSTQISKNADCPVLLIPPKTSKKKTTEVLYPLKTKIKNLENINWLFQLLNPTIHLIHFDTTEIHSPMIKEMLGEKSPLLDSENPLRITYESNKCDDIDECIREYIKENDIDLLVLEKGKEHLFEFLLHRSVTEKILDNINIPVLVLNDRQKSRRSQNGLKRQNKITTSK